MPEPFSLPAPWPQIASVFPGALIHGSGTWLQGRRKTAERLLWLESSSLLLTVASGFVLFRTGAARDVVGPTALTSVMGVGSFGTSFIANVYATLAPPEGYGGPRMRLPLLESQMGYRYVYDPQFEYRHFLTTRLDAWLSGVHLGTRTAHAPDQDNQRYEVLAGYRLIGPGGHAWVESLDGSFLELATGYSQHHFDGEGFRVWQWEVSLVGRLDSDRYLPDVHGAFFQYQAGYARQYFDFDLPGVSAVTENGMLLARTGFGVYLGNRGRAASSLGPTGGEAEIYYDHRHDGLAGGIKTLRIGNGPVGHVGLAASYQLTPRWGLAADVKVGAAWILGLSAVMRAGVE